MEKKITKTYRYDEEVIKHAEQNERIKSFSQWACDKYRSEFMELTAKKLKLAEIEKQAYSLREEIKALDNKAKTTILGLHEKLFIQTEAKERIRNSTFDGVYKWFTNSFGRKDLTRRQFRLLVEKYGGYE